MSHARWLWTFLSSLLLLVLVACDRLNEPMSHPKSPSFTPESSSSSSTGGVSTDGGAGSRDGASPGPAPSITPQPGDIQI